MQSCCCSDEVTNRHCEVGEVARATRARGAADVLREVGRATRTRGAADVLGEEARATRTRGAADVLGEEARATRARGAADVLSEVARATRTRGGADVVNDGVVARASVETSHRVVTMEVRAVGDLEVVEFRLKFGVIYIGTSGEVGAAVSGEVRHRSKCGGGLLPSRCTHHLRNQRCK